MSDTQKQAAVQKQANGASPKPKPQNNKNNNTNTSNDGFKSVGKPRNQQNGANGSPKPNNNNNNKPKQGNNNNANGQQRRPKQGGNNTPNNKPKQQQGNQQQAPSTPTLKGKISNEHYELVLEVVQGTNGYFSEHEAWATLQDNNHNVKNTIEVLNQKKGSNWSAMVRKGLPQSQPVVQQQQPAAPKEKTQSRPNQKKKADNQANGNHVEKVDPVVKEQDLIRDIENNLEEWAQLKNKLESVKNGELQINLTKLTDDRALLKKRQAELEQELKTIKSTLATVETDINKLEKEKAQHLKALEEEKAKLLAKAKK